MLKKETIDLHAVRLCFLVVAKNDKSNHYVISSDPIYNKQKADLKIIDISAVTSSVTGGEKIILLSNKVKREEIDVKFFEMDGKNKKWEKDARILNVHHQYAITFETPEHPDYANVMTPRKCFVKLYRRADKESSEAIPFEYKPCEQSTCAFFISFNSRFFINIFFFFICHLQVFNFVENGIKSLMKRYRNS